MRDSRPVRDLREVRSPALRLLGDAAPTALPPNPVVPQGVRMLYMGTVPKRLEGAATGFVYHAAPERRELDVHPADVASVLMNRAFVRAD